MVGTSQTALPTIFMPHGGGPCFFMDWDPPEAWDKMAAYLRGIPASLPEKPKALLVISAHWEEAEFTLSTNTSPSLYFDYYGFPPHTYQLTYPAPFAPDIAARVGELLDSAHIPFRKDPTRNYDHGVFIPLKVAFPDADIPIVQMSLKKGLDPAEHLALGAALAPLRKEGVLIIGSGMTYHNMRVFMASMNGKAAPNQSAIFDAWLSETLTVLPEARRLDALRHWQQADGSGNAHPPPHQEHFVPLLVVAGAAQQDTARVDFTDTVMGAVLSAYRFG